MNNKEIQGAREGEMKEKEIKAEFRFKVEEISGNERLSTKGRERERGKKYSNRRNAKEIWGDFIFKERARQSRRRSRVVQHSQTESVDATCSLIHLLSA